MVDSLCDLIQEFTPVTFELDVWKLAQRVRISPDEWIRTAI